MFSVMSVALQAQISETNTDEIYKMALVQYQQQNFSSSLEYTKRGLELAPGYHDIRILQIRNEWALDRFSEAENDLNYLLKNAAEYPDVKELSLHQAGMYKDQAEALDFVNRTLEYYPEDLNLQSLKASLLLRNRKPKAARDLAQKLLKINELDSKQRYLLQTVLKRTISNEIGVSYQLVNFSEEYNRDTWQTYIAEYQHSFQRTVVLGRVNYTDRGYDQGTLYELEAYPVFNDRFYAFTNIGFSDGSLYPDLRGSLSVYYNFAHFLEAEAGGRLLHFSNKDFFSGILGLTAYQGRFYLNTRAFLGPKRLGKLIQNYQFNIRYYLQNADNYLFGRLGSGISPDESLIFTQVQENPDLKAYYFNFGINKTLGTHHIFQLSAGYLFEDITSAKKGNQFLGSLGYRYRF